MTDVVRVPPPIMFVTLPMTFPHESHLDQILAILPDGEVAGTVTVAIDGDLLEFSRLWVPKDKRRLGIGRALMKRIIDIAQHQKIESVSAQVHPKNEEAMAFYRSLGFFCGCAFESGLVLMTIQIGL